MDKFISWSHKQILYTATNTFSHLYCCVWEYLTVKQKLFCAEPKCKQRTEQMVYEYMKKQHMSVYKERAYIRLMSIENNFPVFSNGILHVQFCESSTVTTVVMLTNEI